MLNPSLSDRQLLLDETEIWLERARRAVAETQELLSQSEEVVLVTRNLRKRRAADRRGAIVRI